MSLKAGKILGINISLDSKEIILEEIKKYLLQNVKRIRQLADQIPIKLKKPIVIVTPNPEQIVLAQGNAQFRKLLNQADVAIPDGIGISLAAKFFKSQIPNLNDQGALSRIAGVDFMEDLVSLAAKQGVRIGLIGGRGGVAVRALECLSTKYPELRGWTVELGDIHLSDLSDLSNLSDLKIITEKIRSTHTQIVFVGLGAPKQEYFIENLKSQISMTNAGMQPMVFMSVGGSFDIISGKIQRAPFLIRSIGFEWAWRLSKEPWRIRRQWAILKFMVLVLKDAVYMR